jgi:hypothetical protein
MIEIPYAGKMRPRDASAVSSGEVVQDAVCSKPVSSLFLRKSPGIQPIRSGSEVREAQKKP